LASLGFLGLVLALACRQPQSPTAPAASVPAQPSAERGAQLYSANCQSCHGGATGGSMMDIPPPHNASGHTWHHPDCQLLQTVLQGSGPMGEMMRQMMGAAPDTPRMPAFEGVLAEEDVRAILAHIKTWWTPDQRESQARATRQACR
jgi:mono/diheme cytochrome c family protein